MLHAPVSENFNMTPKLTCPYFGRYVTTTRAILSSLYNLYNPKKVKGKWTNKQRGPLIKGNSRTKSLVASGFQNYYRIVIAYFTIITSLYLYIILYIIQWHSIYLFYLFI